MKGSAGKILMLVDKPYELDLRVRREACTLTAAGHGVRVISLDRERPAARRAEVEGVVVYRVPRRSIFRKSSRSTSLPGVLLYRLTSFVGYLLEFLYFMGACLVLVPYVACRDGFDVIHVHNPPNVLTLVALLYKLLGKRYVFDHHDLEPELYLSRYRLRRGPLYRLLVGMEIISIRAADMVIATNESYRDIDVSRAGISGEKVFVVRNGPQLAELQTEEVDAELAASGKTILVYVGYMGPQDGVDYLLRALHHLRYSLGRTDFLGVIIGTGDALEDLRVYARQLQLGGLVRFTGFIERAQLLRLLNTADICLDPNPSSPMNDSSTWIKVMEYMAFAKPVVSFDLPETRFTAADSAVYVTPNDEAEYAGALASLMDDPVERRRLGAAGYRRVRDQLAWEHVCPILLQGYQWLLSGGRPGSPGLPVRPSGQAVHAAGPALHS